MGGGSILNYHNWINLLLPFSFKAKRAKKHDITKYCINVTHVPRIWINELTGKDTVSLYTEIKNFEKYPLKISWAKCSIPLASDSFVEVENHKPVDIPPQGYGQIIFEDTLTPGLVEKAIKKFGTDNGLRGGFDFELKASTKKAKKDIRERKGLMVELVHFKKDRELSENDIKALLTGWAEEQVKKSTLATVEFEKLDAEIKIPLGSAKKHLKDIVLDRWNYKVDQEGDNYIHFRLGPPIVKSRRRTINPGLSNW